MSTKAIEQFLQTAYSDEKLAALLAHAEDGKLSWSSCCCLRGFPSAAHAYKGWLMPPYTPHDDNLNQDFIAGAAFQTLATTDAERRAKLIPMIRAEIARRDALRIQDGRDTRDSVRSQELAGVLIGD